MKKSGVRLRRGTVPLGLLLLLTLLLLGGCSGKGEEIDRAMALRAQLLRCSSCSFDAAITADYGDKLYEFTLACQGGEGGQVDFTVTAPESISGITGSVTEQEGKLTFDDVALQFARMADGQVTPVTAPWLLLKTLRGGYLTAAGADGELLRLTLDDSYQEDALHLDVWLDGENRPVRGEILFDGKRILTVKVTNFQIL